MKERLSQEDKEKLYKKGHASILTAIDGGQKIIDELGDRVNEEAIARGLIIILQDMLDGAQATVFVLQDVENIAIDPDVRRAHDEFNENAMAFNEANYEILNEHGALIVLPTKGVPIELVEENMGNEIDNGTDYACLAGEYDDSENDGGCCCALM
jgi:hypothetical protein